jgi:hypothetical protein
MQQQRNYDRRVTYFEEVVLAGEREARVFSVFTRPACNCLHLILFRSSLGPAQFSETPVFYFNVDCSVIFSPSYHQLLKIDISFEPGR